MDEQSQSQPINIVPMGPEHIETLARLEQVCFSSPWSFDALAGELSDPLAVFRVATVNGQVAGYVGMQHILDEGYICNIAVFPEYRRRGVATALCDRLERAAGGRVYTFASVTARPFFEKRGYVTLRPNEVIRRGVTLTNFLMEKPCF